MLRLEKIIFYLLIFCLSWQTRVILWQAESAFNEWQSAFFYLTDLLLIALLILWLWRLSFQEEFKIRAFFLGLFVLVALISLFQASNLELGFYSWLKLLEFVCLFFYLKQNFKKLFRPRRLAQILIASGLFQSVIAILQYAHQQSLGLKYLGESFLGPQIAGVAKFTVDGTKIIRAYGTLPHPNILAGFLLVGLFCLYFLYLSKKRKSIYSYLFFGLLYAVLFLGLWLTFSRVIISVFLLASLFYFIFFFKKFRKSIISLFLLFIILCLLSTVLLWPEVSSRADVSLSEQAVQLRLTYNQIAFSFIKDYPWLGVGLGNFVWQTQQLWPDWSTWQYQPAHNIYLLIAAETGLIGLVIFLYFLFLIIKRGLKKKNLFSTTFIILLFAFLLISLFDHFFWTLQQGQLMFWLVLGVIVSQRV